MTKAKAFVVIDHTNEKSIHMALGREGAIQAHMVHYGLLCLNQEPRVRSTRSLPQQRRERLCWDSLCLLASMSTEEGGEDGNSYV